ncbi:signal peptidase II Aspartic peptidase. MEROPS family A08 [Singulisphaera sp. GP187]|uniref:signal peptidase II n=1 Tax=Singulisphaera sp. GP187 TaxID=1882752 RepID=UPI00092698B0|nr:signal peptidase II [Singulisphaera sp. GP187]SIO01524.1 signal peptidase II Aspartic peptidase. MEROPS family A08 [Singulisphaera sp. GP187]
MNESVGWSRWILFWSIALGGAAFDLVTKAIVFNHVGPPGSRPVSLIPNILELHTNFNRGALWGFGRSLPNSSLVFAGLSVIAAVAILYYLFVYGGAADGWLTAALGLIMAGALGNCYDRVVLGHVRDFVHFHVDAVGFDCAIFNFADNMLVAGAIVIMLLAVRTEQPEPPKASLESSVPSA